MAVLKARISGAWVDLGTFGEKGPPGEDGIQGIPGTVVTSVTGSQINTVAASTETKLFPDLVFTPASDTHRYVVNFIVRAISEVASTPGQIEYRVKYDGSAASSLTSFVTLGGAASGQAFGGAFSLKYLLPTMTPVSHTIALWGIHNTGTRNYYPTIAWIEAVGGTGAQGPPGTAIIQEDGTALTQRANLNFVGADLLAADDAANSRTNVSLVDNMRWRGVGSSLPPMSSIKKGDIIEYYWGYWLWNSVIPPTAWPLSSEPWFLVGRPPHINQGQLAAWTSVQPGDMAYVSPTSGTAPTAIGYRLLVYNGVTSTWQYADPGKESISVPAQAVPNMGGGAVVFPYTSWTLMCPATITYSASIWLVRSSGSGQMDLRMEGPGISGSPVGFTRQHMDSGNVDANLSGTYSLYQPNTGNMGVQGTCMRTSGDIITSSNGGTYHMTISW